MAARDRLAPASLLLAVHTLFAGACNNGSTGEADSADAGEPEAGVMCPGVAYTRTDVPGTALCLDGPDTFQCAWTSNNAALNGYMVQGDHAAAGDRLTLAYPTDPARTMFTEYTFDVLYGVDGGDLVLELTGARAGVYREVGSWIAAVAGDAGICGSGSAATGGTCDEPCTSDADCSDGESCLGTSEGDRCLPSACNGCFDIDQFCNYYVDPCEFAACSASVSPGSPVTSIANRP